MTLLQTDWPPVQATCHLNLFQGSQLDLVLHLCRYHVSLPELPLALHRALLLQVGLEPASNLWVLMNQIALLPQDVHEGQSLKRSAEGKISAGTGRQGEQAAVHGLLGDHLHHCVPTACSCVRDFLHVTKGISATLNETVGALVVLHLGPRRHRGCVSGCQ